MEIIRNLLTDFEAYRTKDELAEYVHSIHNIIKQSDELKKLSRLKKGRLKQFWEELIPLYRYSQSSYANDNAKYRVVIGNQNYDAIELINGEEHRLEFTEFYNGKQDYQEMVSLNNGEHGVIVSDPIEDREQLLDGFRRNVHAKSLKGYVSTKIIFTLPLHKFHFIFEDDVELLKDELVQIIDDADFGDNETFLIMKGNSFYDDLEESITMVDGR